MLASLLLSATKLGRLCFYTCLSFCPQGGGLPQCMLGYHPPPPGTRPLGGMVTISVAKYSVVMTHHNAASGRHLIPETRCQDAGFFITVRNEVGKVMFLHLSVILSTGGEGLPQCMLGYHPPGTRHPPQSRHPPGPGPPKANTPRTSPPPPRDQVTPEQTPPPWDQVPRSRHPLPGSSPPWSRHPLGPGTPPPPQETATCADGTHPTGIHSCLNKIYIVVHLPQNQLCCIFCIF